MSRIRTIKPSFWKSQTVAEWSDPAKLTFLGLLNYCDDEGRGIDDARLIKAEVWPLDDKKTPRRITGWIDEMVATGSVLRYEIDGRNYIAIPGWQEHQRIDKPRESSIPPPPEFLDCSATPPGAVVEASRLEVEVEVEREVETGSGTDVAPTALAQRSDPEWEAFCDVTNVDWHELSDKRRGELNGMLASLRRHGATAEEIRRRAENHAATWTVPLTPETLVRRWAELGTARPESPRASRHPLDQVAARAMGS